MVSINRFGMLYIYFSNTPGNQSCARVIVCELSKYYCLLAAFPFLLLYSFTLRGFQKDQIKINAKFCAF